MTKLNLLVALTVMASLLSLSPASAEEEAGPAYLLVHYDTVEPSKAMEFEANGKQWVEAFTSAEMGEEWTWDAYSKPDFTYAWVSVMPDYAYLDGQPEREKMMAEALGEEKVGELMAGAGAVRSHYSDILKAAPEMSYHPKEPLSSDPRFVRVGVHHVKPAMTRQFKDLVKRVVAAYQKAEAPLGFDAYEVEFGQGSFAFVSEADNAAQFYSQPQTGEILAQAEGAEVSQQLFQEWRDCISAYEISDWAYRPDLSYTPGMSSGETEGAEGTD